MNDMSDFSNFANFTLKHCPRCAHVSRIAAKICSQCGYAFPKIELTGMTPRKLCASCDYPNRVQANVCSQCGHRFKTTQAQKSAQPAVSALPVGEQRAKWCPRCGQVCRLQAKVCTQCGHHFRTNFNADKVAEIPVAQQPDVPIVLPQDFEPSPAPMSTISTAPPSNILEGEPAPDMSDKQLDAMRYSSPANTDPYGRLILSLKRGRA